MAKKPVVAPAAIEHAFDQPREHEEKPFSDPDEVEQRFTLTLFTKGELTPVDIEEHLEKHALIYRATVTTD